MAESVAIAGTAAGDEITDERPDPDPDGDGLIGMLMHGFIGCLGAFNRFVPDAPIDFLAALQCGGETLAGFPDFFAGDVGGGSEQGARIFGQLAHVIADCLCVFIHVVMFFHWYWLVGK